MRRFGAKRSNRLVAEYALRDTSRPIGISAYQLTALPAALQGSLPTIEELEAGLGEAREGSGALVTLPGL